MIIRFSFDGRLVAMPKDEPHIPTLAPNTFGHSPFKPSSSPVTTFSNVVTSVVEWYHPKEYVCQRRTVLSPNCPQPRCSPIGPEMIRYIFQVGVHPSPFSHPDKSAVVTPTGQRTSIWRSSLNHKCGTANAQVTVARRTTPSDPCPCIAPWSANMPVPKFIPALIPGIWPPDHLSWTQQLRKLLLVEFRLRE